MKKTTASVISITAMVFVSMVLAVSAVDATVVSVEPASQTVLSGQNFSVNVSVDTVTNLTLHGANLNFDPAAMEATAITEGITSGLPHFMEIATIDNTNGVVTFMYALDEGCTVSGSGPLVTINFTSNESAECTFDLDLTDVELWNETAVIPLEGVNDGTVSLDKTAPTVDITSPADGHWFDSEDVLISFRPWDNKDQELDYKIYDNGEEIKNGAAPNGSVTTVNFGQAIPECNHVIRVNVTDNAGLEGSAQITIHIDRTYPTVEIISPKDDEWFDSEPVNVTFRPWDNKADVLDYSIFLDDVEVANGTADNCSDKEVSLGILEESCNYKIEVQVTDKAGKTNYSVVFINVDLTPPTVEIITPVSRTYASTCVRLNYTADDPGECPSGINWTAYNLDGTGNVTITGNTTIADIGAGTHTVIVYVEDKVDKGNSSAEISFTLHPGDIDFNGHVWVGDVFALRAAYNTHPGDDLWNEDADLNCNNHVWTADVFILRDNYGNYY